jgi:hypothetical protein
LEREYAESVSVIPTSAVGDAGTPSVIIEVNDGPVAVVTGVNPCVTVLSVKLVGRFIGGKRRGGGREKKGQLQLMTAFVTRQSLSCPKK